MVCSKWIRDVFERGNGIFKLIPSFVPRNFGTAGGRLRLHPDDYFALGMVRGSIKERWLSSVVPAMNGDMAPWDEGMSYITGSDTMKDKFLLKEAVEELGEELVGKELMQKYGTWPMYSKFFDYKTPLFHHLHLDDVSAGAVGRIGKPEAYYFPAQMNNYLGDFPLTYFGLDQSISIEQFKERLLHFQSRDIRITELSRAYRIELGTGWYTPPGVLHAPGSCLTYEPQWNSDVFAVFENVAGGEVFPYSMMVQNCPEDKKTDIDYILGMLDWGKNIDPDYRKKYFRPPVMCEKKENAYDERWIAYGNAYVAAKEVTIQPQSNIVLKDAGCFGCIIIQGFGKFGGFDAEAASILRYGQLSADEYFVSEKSASEGVAVMNHSRCEPMVILQHFGPNNPQTPRLEVER